MNSMMAQRGMSYWGYIFLIIIIVVLGKLGYATIPAYLEDRALDAAITEKLEQNKTASGSEILEKINKQLSMDFSDVKIEDVVEVKQNMAGAVILLKKYDVRNNLFANIDVITHFEKEYTQ